MGNIKNILKQDSMLKFVYIKKCLFFLITICGPNVARSKSLVSWTTPAHIGDIECSTILSVWKDKLINKRGTTTTI